MMKMTVRLTVNICLVVAVTAVDAAQRQSRPAPPEPTHANLRYGPHERNVLDLYLAESEEPTPLVLYIHGGGFRGGDKRSLRADAV